MGSLYPSLHRSLRLNSSGKQLSSQLDGAEGGLSELSNCRLKLDRIPGVLIAIIGAAVPWGGGEDGYQRGTNSRFLP
jgi:hypothetical protein